MRRLVAPAWLARHALAAALVTGFLALGWWQVGRAAGGNSLSWAYAVQWPVFAGFVLLVWAREIRRAVGRPTDHAVAARTARTAVQPARRPVLTARPAPVPDDRDDPDLAAYNQYLAWLNANPGARPGQYRWPAGAPQSRRAP